MGMPWECEGVEDHRAPASVVPEQNGQEDDLDIFALTQIPSNEVFSSPERLWHE